MKLKKIWMLIVFGCLLTVIRVPAAPVAVWAQEAQISLDTIMERIESRYAASGFQARFDQQSTIKSMDITDMAGGRIYVKRPDKMRWEYDFPERQTVVTDGSTLWIYRPEDNQVLVGRAPEYFGGGKGAAFLSDIRTLRDNFTLSLESPDDGHHKIKLIPKKKTMDLHEIYLSVSKDLYDVAEIITYNAYQDQTLIRLSHVVFDKNLSDSMFTFAIPRGAEVLKLEQ